MSSPTQTDPIEGELVESRPAPVAPAQLPGSAEWFHPAPVQVNYTYNVYLGSERIYRDAEAPPEAAETAFGYRPGEYLIDNTGSSTRTLLAFVVIAVLLLAAAMVLL